MKIKFYLLLILSSFTLLSSCVINVGNEKEEDYVWQYNDEGHWKYYFNGNKGDVSPHKLKNDGEPIRQSGLFRYDTIIQFKKCSVCPYDTFTETTASDHIYGSREYPASYDVIAENKVDNNYVAWYKHDFDGRDQYGYAYKWSDHVSIYRQVKQDTELHFYIDVKVASEIYFSVSEILGSGSFVLQDSNYRKIEPERYYLWEGKIYAGNSYNISFYSLNAKPGKYYFSIYHKGYGDDTYCSYVSCENWYKLAFSDKKHSVPNQ